MCLLSPNQQEPAAGLQNPSGSKPGDGYSGNQRTGNSGNSGRDSCCGRKWSADEKYAGRIPGMPLYWNHYSHGSGWGICRSYCNFWCGEASCKGSGFPPESFWCFQNCYADWRPETGGRTGCISTGNWWGLQRASAGWQGFYGGKAFAGKAGSGKTGLCRRWNQRCPGSFQSRYWNCHGSYGLRCCYWGSRCGFDGWWSYADCKGNSDFP